MKPPPDPSYRHRFPAEIISHAVWLYHVLTLSLRDVELLLAERGVVVSYEAVRRWCQKFAAGHGRVTSGRWTKSSSGSEVCSTTSGARSTKMALCSISLFRRDAMPALRSASFGGF